MKTKNSHVVKQSSKRRLKKEIELAADDLTCTKLERGDKFETLRFIKTLYPGKSPSTAALENFREYVNKCRVRDAKATSRTVLRLAKEPKNSEFWKLLIKNAKMTLKAKDSFPW